MACYLQYNGRKEDASALLLALGFAQLPVQSDSSYALARKNVGTHAFFEPVNNGSFFILEQYKPEDIEHLQEHIRLQGLEGLVVLETDFQTKINHLHKNTEDSSNSI
jgi:hypothetical protein